MIRRRIGDPSYVLQPTDPGYINPNTAAGLTIGNPGYILQPSDPGWTDPNVTLEPGDPGYGGTTTTRQPSRFTTWWTSLDVKKRNWFFGIVMILLLLWLFKPWNWAIFHPQSTEPAPISKSDKNTSVKTDNTVLNPKPDLLNTKPDSTVATTVVKEIPDKWEEIPVNGVLLSGKIYFIPQGYIISGDGAIWTKGLKIYYFDKLYDSLEETAFIGYVKTPEGRFYRADYQSWSGKMSIEDAQKGAIQDRERQGIKKTIFIVNKDL